MNLFIIMMEPMIHIHTAEASIIGLAGNGMGHMIKVFQMVMNLMPN